MPESETPVFTEISSGLGGLLGKRGENFVFLFFAMLPPS
jgi:hypothetical protein